MRSTRSTKVAACGMPNASKPCRVVLGELGGPDGSEPSSDSLTTGPYSAITEYSGASDVSSPPGSQYNLSLHIHRECANGRKVVDRIDLVAVSGVEKLPSNTGKGRPDRSMETEALASSIGTTKP